jgi:hypothetical protein
MPLQVHYVADLFVPLLKTKIQPYFSKNLYLLKNKHAPFPLIYFVVGFFSAPQREFCRFPIIWQLPYLTFNQCPVLSTAAHSSQIKENNIKASKP